jgi:hypothetical protein
MYTRRFGMLINEAVFLIAGVFLVMALIHYVKPTTDPEGIQSKCQEENCQLCAHKLPFAATPTLARSLSEPVTTD